MMKALSQLDRYLRQGGDPSIVPVLRIAYGCLVIIHMLTLWPNAEMWFTDDGVLSTQTAQALGRSYNWSILFWLPSTTEVVKLCLGLMLLHSVFLILGVASRFQAAFLFVWLVSFQNRNFLILDGEDTIMRLFAFFMIWLPLDDRCSLTASLLKIPHQVTRSRSPWALRLFQFELIALYASTALCKLQGNTWHDGTAMWYVSKMTDNFGRLIPATWFDLYGVTAFATWSALLLELSLPIALLILQTRKWAMVAAMLLHLGIEVSMNLFLFQWFMILGLLSFYRTEDWRWITNRLRMIFRSRREEPVLNACKPN